MMQLIPMAMGWVLLSSALQAAILPLTLIEKGSGDDKPFPLDTEKFGYLELKPNGSLILRRGPGQSGSNRQNLLLLRGVLQAIKQDNHHSHGGSELNIRIYGDGVEHKFPPLLENIIQRIQTYFSVYRYTDTSQPVRRDEAPTKEAIDADLGVTTVRTGGDEDDLIAIGEQDAYITVGEGAD
ncbi:GL20861 [Drosophila persimilis]|uniref:GL20861 n=2 Tax=Drosophila persimilis TaxID=7234 RepID=B4H4D8_DROPE|nr:GL20861 [Drosophila persimilis]